MKTWLPARMSLLVAGFILSGCISRPIDEPRGPSATLLSEPSAGRSLATATGTVTAGETLAPPAEPVPSAAGPQIRVAIKSEFGANLVRIESNGLVESGRPATQAELEKIDFASGGFGAQNLADGNLLIAWIGSICDRSTRVVLVPTAIFIAPDPRPGCDAIGFGWGVVVRTQQEFDARAVTIHLAPTTLLP